MKIPAEGIKAVQHANDMPFPPKLSLPIMPLMCLKRPYFKIPSDYCSQCCIGNNHLLREEVFIFKKVFCLCVETHAFNYGHVLELWTKYHHPMHATLGKMAA